MSSRTNDDAPAKRHLAYRQRHRAASHDTAHAETEAPPADNFPDSPLICRDRAQLIIDDAALAELIAHLRSAKSFAYDTEFIGEMTYHPQLCLVQVATAERIALIDPLADVSLDPFWELLTDASIEKLVHAGAQDVEPVHRNTGKPAVNVFDTQIAAGFCALAYPVALGKLVNELLGYKMSKGHTFTDWQRRPLSNSQLRYAADDVRFLPAMVAELKARLKEFGHTDWSAQECAAMCDPSRYAFDSESDFYSMRGAGSLSFNQLAVLRALMIWRNDAARENDVPPRAFVRDEALIDLSRQPAKTTERLTRVKFLPRPIVDRHGDAIVQLTLDALANPPKSIVVQKPAEPLPSERFRAESVWAAAQAICLSQGLDPAAVASRQEVAELDRAFAADESLDSLKVMTGWRRDALGNRLVELLRGQREVTMKWVGQRLAEREA